MGLRCYHFVTDRKLPNMGNSLAFGGVFAFECISHMKSCVFGVINFKRQNPRKAGEEMTIYMQGELMCSIVIHWWLLSGAAEKFCPYCMETLIDTGRTWKLHTDNNPLDIARAGAERLHHTVTP